jgi:hypothetical protein
MVLRYMDIAIALEEKTPIVQLTAEQIRILSVLLLLVGIGRTLEFLQPFHEAI